MEQHLNGREGMYELLYLVREGLTIEEYKEKMIVLDERTDDKESDEIEYMVPFFPTRLKI